MATIGISITKQVAFRNSTQEFSNVYYYTGGGTPSASEADTLIDTVADREKLFHANLVTFTRGRLWTQTGSQATNNMISQKNLSGVGARASNVNMDRERAFLFRLRAGVDSRGQPVYLRKWFHVCGVFYSGQTVSSDQLANVSGFSSTERASMVSAMNSIGDITGPNGPWKLCAKSGRLPTAGETWVAHPFLEHHQMGDQWRAS